MPFLSDCKKVVSDCNDANLPKLTVEVTCCFGNIARALQMYSNAVKAGITKANEITHEAIWTS